MPDPITIDFWFDASCPYTWRTAQWARVATETRDVRLDWHLMSLYRLNAGSPDLDAEGRARLERTRLPMRVLAAVADEGPPGGVETTYFALGRRLHDESRPSSTSLLEEALVEAGLDPAMAGAADDDEWDKAVFESHDAAQAAVGEDAGSPVLSVDGTQAFFGPVITAVPSGPASGQLLDGLVALARVREFSSLERSRTERS